MAEPRVVSHDPGLRWQREDAVVIDAPPDDDIHPEPDAVWSLAAQRSGRCGAVTPDVVAMPGGYRMYYTQILPAAGHVEGANDYDQATTRILSAWSDDAITWRPEPGVRLSPQQGGAGDCRVVSPRIVPAGSDTWRMYYECRQDPASPSTIRSALSSDGLTWDVEAGDRLSGGGDYCAVRVVEFDRGFRMYASSRGVGIISAWSETGGGRFEPEPGVRIEPTPGTADGMTAFAPEVVALRDRTWRMYYAGYARSNRASICSATSANGLTWIKEPAVALAPGGRWDAVKCSEMCLLSLGQGAETSYRLFYEGCDGTSTDERGVWRILSASATAMDTR